MRAGLIFLMLLCGCLSTTNHNPMKQERKNPAWWQADTASVTTDNPWEAFVRKPPVDNSLNPWADFKHPPLFPTNWTPAVKYQQSEILKLRRRILRLRKKLRQKRAIDKYRRRLERQKRVGEPKFY